MAIFSAHVLWGVHPVKESPIITSSRLPAKRHQSRLLLNSYISLFRQFANVCWQPIRNHGAIQSNGVALSARHEFAAGLCKQPQSV
jgi:hypothetical protein